MLQLPTMPYGFLQESLLISGKAEEKKESGMTPKGIVIYDGPSLFDGQRIVVIVTGMKRSSRNRKTGRMLHSWILLADKPPMQAQYTGDDKAICNNCKHRTFRSCYVNIIHGPTHVWEAWKAGVYPKVDCWDSSLDSLVAGKHIRLGSYGDPAGVPLAVWSGLVRGAEGFTGYSHSWSSCNQKLKQFCMASCETLEEVERAKLKGWRVFYARRENEKLPTGFFICPASAEAGKKTNCHDCNSCRGGEYNGKPMPSIRIHGSSWKTVFYERGMERIRNHRKVVGVAWKISPKQAAKRTMLPV